MTIEVQCIVRPDLSAFREAQSGAIFDVMPNASLEEVEALLDHFWVIPK